LKWLASLLFGWKILSKKQKENREILRGLWAANENITGTAAGVLGD